MRKTIFVVFLLALLVGVGWSAEKKSIDARSVPLRSTRDLLINRFGLVEGDIENIMSLQNKGTGNFWYVDSGVGSSSYDGKDWTHAKATLDSAIALCTANNGDVIFVAQGHAETLAGANGVDIDVAGVTVIGLGSGPDRPKFTLDTTTDEFVIGSGGDGTVIYNLQFLPGVSEVVHCVTIEDGAENVSILSCEFLESVTAAYEFDKAITVEVDANDLTIANCTFTSADAVGATDAIEIGDGIATRLKIIGCKFYGEYSSAPIWSDTVNTDMEIRDNLVCNLTTAQFGIEFTAAATGIITNNVVLTDSLATSIDYGSAGGYGTNTMLRYPVKEDLSVTPRAVKCTTGATLIETGDTIFTVVGGPVLCTALVGRVTNALDAGFGNLSVNFNPSDGAIADAAICGVVAAGSAAIGDTFRLGGAATTDALVKATTGFAYLGPVATITDPCDPGYLRVVPMKLYLPPGVMTTVVSGTAAASDAIVWYMEYTPLTFDAFVDPNA